MQVRVNPRNPSHEVVRRVSVDSFEENRKSWRGLICWVLQYQRRIINLILRLSWFFAGLVNDKCSLILSLFSFLNNIILRSSFPSFFIIRFKFPPFKLLFSSLFTPLLSRVQKLATAISPFSRAPLFWPLESFQCTHAPVHWSITPASVRLRWWRLFFSLSPLRSPCPLSAFDDLPLFLFSSNKYSCRYSRQSPSADRTWWSSGLISSLKYCNSFFWVTHRFCCSSMFPNCFCSHLKTIKFSYCSCFWTAKLPHDLWRHIHRAIIF